MNKTTLYEDVVRCSYKEIFDGVSVSYVLTKETLHDRASYSISAEIPSLNEYATAKDITSDSATADTIFEAVSDGIVTPCCLCEIVEDLIESILWEQ